MFRLMFGNRHSTMKPIKNHTPGSKREQMSSYTLKTLGSGDLQGNIINFDSFFILNKIDSISGAVKLPPGEDLNEWLAANSKIFFFFYLFKTSQLTLTLFFYF